LRIARFGPNRDITKKMEITSGSRREIKSDRRLDKIRQKTRMEGGREATALNSISDKIQRVEHYQTMFHFLETMSVRIEKYQKPRSADMQSRSTKVNSNCKWPTYRNEQEHKA
jgi:hypothetical protein